MYNWVMLGYIVFLFFLLTPNILLRLPPKSSKYVVAFVHALVFAAVFHFTHNFVLNMSMSV